MKRITLAVSLALMSTFGFSQAVSCDLSLSGAEITDASGSSLDANTISLNQVVGIKVTIGNFVSGNVAPAGHFRIRIGLGSGFVLNSTYNLATAPLSNYFNWSYDITGAQPQIVGNSIAALPADFDGDAFFQLRSKMPTNSTVSFNFLVSNPPGTTTPLSDPAYSNNSATNTYTVTTVILPVTLTGFTAAVKDCNLNIEWNVKSQQNLSHYEVEISKDGVAFTKASEVLARSQEKYNLSIALTEALKAPVLYIRLKSVDKDGNYKYSQTLTTKGQCENAGKLIVSVYPNPATYVSYVTVSAVTGSFNGKYKVSLIDKGGKTYQINDMEFNNLTQFKYPFGNIAAGSYSIVIKGENEMNSAVVEFTKL